MRSETCRVVLNLEERRDEHYLVLARRLRVADVEMNDELKQLIEDAARLLGLEMVDWRGSPRLAARFEGETTTLLGFNPCDPERGDLMKVAIAAELRVDYQTSTVTLPVRAANDLATMLTFTRSDHQSLAIAVLRAASAVWKARGEQ